MNLFSFFNVHIFKPEFSEKLASIGEKQPAAVGAFITPQSLLSFPVASGLVIGLWKLAQILAPSFGESVKTLLIIALVMGILIWIISISDPEIKLTRRQWIISFIIAIINSLVLAMTALGINQI